MILRLLDDVDEAKSCCSTRAAESPISAASRKMAAPWIPPPITRTSCWREARVSMSLFIRPTEHTIAPCLKQVDDVGLCRPIVLKLQDDWLIGDWSVDAYLSEPLA